MKLKKTNTTLKQVNKLISENSEKKKDLKFVDFLEHSEIYGGYQNGILNKFAMVNVFGSRVFAVRTKLGFLSHIINFDEELFKEIASDLHEEKITYVNFQPKNSSINKEFSFVDTAFKKFYHFNFSAIKKFQDQAPERIKEGTWNDLIIQNDATQLYEVPLHTMRERNTIDRPYWWWEMMQKIHPLRKLVVSISRQGIAQAYMFVTERKGHVMVDELFSMSEDGEIQLLKYLAQMGNQKTRYTICMPLNAELEKLIPAAEQIKTDIKAYSMSRIVDFAKLLTFMKAKECGEFVLEVTKDSICPWNVGKWSCKVIQGKIKVEASEKTADFSGDIASWAKVLLGESTLKDAIDNHEIKQNTDSNLEFDKGTITFF